MLGRKIWGVSGKDEQLPDSMCSKLNGKSLPGGNEGPNSSKFKIDVFHAARKTSKFQRLFWQRWVVTAVSSDGNRFLQNPGVCGVGILQRNSARVFLPGRPTAGRDGSGKRVDFLSSQFIRLWINCKQCGRNENLVGTCGEYVGNRGKMCRHGSSLGGKWQKYQQPESSQHCEIFVVLSYELCRTEGPWKVTGCGKC